MLGPGSSKVPKGKRKRLKRIPQSNLLDLDSVGKGWQPLGNKHDLAGYSNLIAIGTHVYSLLGYDAKRDYAMATKVMVLDTAHSSKVEMQ